MWWSLVPAALGTQTHNNSHTNTMTGKLRHQARSLCLTLMVGADGEMVVDRKESEGEEGVGGGR